MLHLLFLLVGTQDHAAESTPAVTRHPVDVSALLAALEPSTDSYILWTPLSERWNPPEEFLEEPRLANWLEQASDARGLVPVGLEKLVAAVAEAPCEIDLEGKSPDYTLVADAVGAAAFEQTVELLESWATRRWNVELIDLPPAAAATLDSAVLAASEVDRLLSMHAVPVTRARFATPRRAARFEEMRRYSYIGDYDLDYIETGLAPDPRVAVARFGRDTHVRIHARSRTSAFVDVETWGGEPDGPPQSVRPFVDEDLELELPSASLFQGIGSGLVADGGALVLAPCGTGGRTLLVRVTRVDDGPDVDGIAAIGLGGLPGVRHMLPAYWLPGPVPSGGEQHHSDALYGVQEDGEPPLVATFEPDELLAAVQEEWTELGLRGAYVRLGAEVMAVGEPKALALLRERARIANRSGERTFSFELRFGAVPSDATRGVVVGAPVPAALAERLVAELATGRRLLGAAAAGGGVLWTDARQASFIQDLDIGVGMGFTLPDPVVPLLSSGFSAACGARPMHGDRLLVSLELRWRTLHEPIRRARALTTPGRANGARQPVIAELDLPEASLRQLVLSVPVVPARWTAVEVATDGSRAEVVLLRVTEEPPAW